VFAGLIALLLGGVIIVLALVRWLRLPDAVRLIPRACLTPDLEERIRVAVAAGLGGSETMAG
jgi:hypothetical protein